MSFTVGDATALLLLFLVMNLVILKLIHRVEALEKFVEDMKQ